MFLIKNFMSLCVLLVTLSACTQTEPTRVNEAPMLSKLSASETIIRNDNDLHDVAALWDRSGQSPVHLIATYRPGDEGVAKRNAQTAADRLKNLGVKDVDVNLLPAAQNTIIAQMKTLTAGAVSGCTKTPETGDVDKNYDYHDYRLGCGVDKYMGMQVAKTRDLEGRVPGQGYDTNSDAQRQGAIVDTYRSGKPNEKLEGLNSSEIAEGN